MKLQENFALHKKFTETLLSLPSMLWLTIVFFIPTFIVVIISFRNADLYGGISEGWSFAAYRALFSPSYPAIVWRTVKLSFLTTGVCLALGIPVAYGMGQMSKRTQQNLLLLIIVPFWTNFLIRIYAWKVLLHPDGLVKTVLVFLGIVSEDALLLYTEGAVLLVLIYTYLPFALLPLYSAAEKFDYSLLEAGRDLGASGLKTFVKVFLPGIKAGIISAVLVVFIPVLGSYIIPEIVGGTTSEMIGNRIAQQVFVNRNIPRAGALSSVLVLIILLPSFLQLGIRKSHNRILNGGGI